MTEPKARVINLRDKAVVAAAQADGSYVRIDRRSPWGNPFTLKEMETKLGDTPQGMTPSGARDLAISAFRAWVEGPSPKAVWIREHVHELRGKTLACWCAPERCHGDVLARLAEPFGVSG